MSIRNNRSYNSSKMDTSDLSLNLSLRGCWVIVYYPACDPGNEYDILSEKDLVDNWDVLQRGVNVVVKFGNARVQGVVVAVSDDFSYLKTNFTNLTEEHQEKINKEIKMKIKMSIESSTHHYSQKFVVKVTDKETQTEETATQEKKSFTEYQILAEKYQKLQENYEKMASLCTEIKADLEGAASKLEIQMPVASPKLVLKSLENCQSKRTSKMVQIGSKGTEIPQTVFDSVNWMSYTAATRKLLITLFTRKVLATHSLTGKPSPAFQTRESKKRLNPMIIDDIVEIISRKCKVSESLVRSAITTKCADENKLYKRRVQKSSGPDKNV